MTDLAPFVTRPVAVNRPWGGSRLASLGKGEGRIAESWEIADLPDGVAPHVADPRSRVGAGPMQGRSLRDIIDRHGSDFLGSASPTAEGDFPLLVKVLDAHQHLSVQVHPHAGYVATHPGTRLKTESWYVVDAGSAATLFLDVMEDVTPSRARSAIGSGTVRDILREVPARPGDFHHLPAGIVHALGAGTLVAEVQTPSDTTFRINDWNDLYEREERDLHLDEAAETILVDPPGKVSLRRMSGTGTRALVTTEHYWVKEHSLRRRRVDFGTKTELRVLMVVLGTVMVNGTSHGLGTTVVVPAGAAPTVTAIVDGVVLEIGLVA